MNGKESSVARVWKERGNRGIRVVVQFPNISAEQGISVQEEICEMMEGLLSQRMNLRSDNSGGKHNG